MNVNSTASIVADYYSKSMNKFNEAATKVSNDEGDQATNVIEMKSAQNGVEVSARLLKMSNEMGKEVLNLL